jgi:hypothetical protein
MKYLTVAVLALCSFSGAQAAETFTGVITDDMCAGVGHARMRMGPTDPECVKACVMYHDSKYVLEAATEAGTRVYALSDQKLPAQFPAQKVRVVGTLDVATRTIQVESIVAAD